MKIAMGADHAGYALKEILKRKLQEWGHEVQDFGTDSEKSVDYPVYGLPVAESVAQGKADRGVVICGNGLGMSYVANKVPGVRAALATSVLLAIQSRLHSNANVLALGGRPETGGIEPEQAIPILEVWLKTEFEGGRHVRRIEEIHQIEEKCDKKS